MANKKYHNIKKRAAQPPVSERTARARGFSELGSRGSQASKAERINKDAYPKKELFLFEPKTLLIIIITSVLTLLVAFFGERGTRLFTSVISPLPEHAPFNGTTFPIKQIPNWVKLTETERKAFYNAISQDKLIPIPSYNPSRLAIPFDNLKWNNANDDSIRNEKITYSVPYLGTYKLDGVENAGSHPAVDIKVPEGTPIYAIANGTVIKAEISSGGFGNHIVIQHNDFPSPDDPNTKGTVYSSYSHLSSIGVKVNDVITKGQFIGAAGSTGTATTPHLHFQIDNKSAPWHPYWPFSGKEMRSAGYSFFQAINNGLGQSNAIAYTINPLRYVQKYFGDQTLVASTAPVSALEAASDPYDSLAFVIQIVEDTKIEEGSEAQFMIQAFDEKGNLVSKPKFQDEIKLSLLNNNGVLNRDTISDAQLRTGIVSSIRVKDTKVGTEKLLLRFRNREFSSPDIEIIRRKALADRILIEPAKTELSVGENLSVNIKVLDQSGNPIPEIVFEENISIVLTNMSIGTLSISTLANTQFINGEAKVYLLGVVPGTAEINVNYNGRIFYSPVITVLAPVAPPQEIVTAPQQEEQPEPVPPITPPTVETPSAAAETSVAHVEETVTEIQEPQEQPVTLSAPDMPPPYLVIPEAIIEAGTTSEPVNSTVGTTTIALPFTDISPENPYYQALVELKASGMVAGYSDGTFKWDKEVTRAEATTFILRAIEEELRENIKLAFPDVSENTWYYPFIGTAADVGFVKGHPDGTFQPESKVNLAEFLTMLFVAAKADIDPQILITLPVGVTQTDWFAPYLQEAIRQNIIEVQNNTLQPEKPLTRGEIAEILWKLKKIEKMNANQ